MFRPRQHARCLLLVVVLVLAGAVAPVAAAPPGPDPTSGSVSSVAGDTSAATAPSTAAVVTGAESTETTETIESTESTESTGTAGAPAIGSSPSADGGPSRALASMAAVDDEIRVATELSLTPRRRGSVGVTQTFTLPDRVVDLAVTLPEGATVTGSRNFEQAGSKTWEWTGSGTPRLSYAMEANETAAQGGPLAGSGSYLFADPGDWALVRRPNIGLRWQQRGNEPVTVTRSASVAGEGVVGGDTAFLGPHRVLTDSAHDQTFRLVVPAAADMREDPDVVFEALASASGTLHVGDRDEEVFVVVAPTDGVDWAVQGLQAGDRDMWVKADQRVGDVENVWVHEYVHSRQSFTTEPSARWLTEATATWYAARLSLKQGTVDFAAFSSFLERGERGPQGSSVLADPGTWQNSAQYLKGGLVAGELDRRIRVESGGSASLQTALRWLNGRSAPVTNAMFLDAVADAGGSAVGPPAKRFTTTRETPEMWDRSAHADAFETVPAQIRVTADPETVRVGGPYREGRLSRPFVVAAGETLSLPVQVENVGGSAGDYRVVLRVDDAVAATAEDRLAGGAATTVRLDHTFEEPGNYTLSIAGERLAVTVREPATPRVTEVRAASNRLAQGDRVEVTAVVENRRAVPGTAEIEFTRDGEVVATRTVTLAAGESTEISTRVRLPESGTHRVGAGEVTVQVDVTGSSGGGANGATQSGDGGSGDGSSVPVPGFGVGAAVTALLVAALLGRYRA